MEGLFLLAMQVFYFLSVINMDFAVATTLSFSSPLFIILLSVIFLKEKVGFFRWGAVAIGFIGVVLIMQPTSSIFTFYSFSSDICFHKLGRNKYYSSFVA